MAERANEILGYVIDKLGINKIASSGKYYETKNEGVINNKQQDIESTKQHKVVEYESWDEVPKYETHRDENNGYVHNKYQFVTCVLYFDQEACTIGVDKTGVFTVSNIFKEQLVLDLTQGKKKHCLLYSIELVSYKKCLPTQAPSVGVDFIYNLDCQSSSGGIHIKKYTEKLHLTKEFEYFYEYKNIFMCCPTSGMDLLRYACGKEDVLGNIIPRTATKCIGAEKVAPKEYLKDSGNVAFHTHSFIGRTLWKFRYTPLDNIGILKAYKVYKHPDYMCVQKKNLEPLKQYIKKTTFESMYYVEDCRFTYDLKFDIGGNIETEKLKPYNRNTQRKAKSVSSSSSSSSTEILENLIPSNNYGNSNTARTKSEEPSDRYLYVGTVILTLHFTYIEKRSNLDLDGIKTL